MAFASNKNALGICDITGFRYNLRDMKKTWNGLIVGPDQWDPKHPQLSPKAAPKDPQAIKNARIETSDDNNFFQVYSNKGNGKLGSKLTTFEVATSLGSITVITT